MLATLPRGELLGILRKRIRQAAAEHSSTWELCRLLRAHVAAALEAGLPPPPESLPLRLVHAGKLSSELISEALAWTLAREDAPERKTNELTTTLLKQYCPRRERLDDVPEPMFANAEGEISVNLDARVHALFLSSLMRPAVCRATSLYVNGTGYESIAARLDISVSTAHAWVREGLGKAAAYARKASLSLSDLRPALALLAEIVPERGLPR